MIISELSSQERTGCLLTTVWNLKFITHPLFPTIVSSLASILDKTTTLDICGQRYTGWGKGYTHPWVPGEADCTAGLRNRCGMQLTAEEHVHQRLGKLLVLCGLWSTLKFSGDWIQEGYKQSQGMWLIFMALSGNPDMALPIKHSVHVTWAHPSVVSELYSYCSSLSP